MKLPLIFFINYFLISLVLFSISLNAQENESQGDEDSETYYILPDFVVSDDQDKGYYSANTLAGTRTNELTKNIPMTIATVNEEMIKDFGMKTLADLGNFVPSIESEENIYNNQEIRFRGFLSRSQLYEFMPRYSPLDYYNVGRADVIRGANSLIYGQADPGGKVNIISKTAEFSKNKKSLAFDIGSKNYTKVKFDSNVLIGDNTAARYLATYNHREFDPTYKYQTFKGSTLELLHNYTPDTRLRLHLEKGQAERSLIGGTFKVGQSPTGLPNGIVADPKLADLLSNEFFEYINDYTDADPSFADINFSVTNFGRRTYNPKLWDEPVGGILIPDFITSREDIKDMFNGIDNHNSGTGFGPDSHSDREFTYVIGELSHAISDELELKLSLGNEDLYTETLQSGWGANQIKFSSGWGNNIKIPSLETMMAYDSDPYLSQFRNPFEDTFNDLMNANYADKLLEGNLYEEINGNVVVTPLNSEEQWRTAVRESLVAWKDERIAGTSYFGQNLKPFNQDPLEDNWNGILINGSNYINADIPNGIYDEGENFTDALNGIYDLGEVFTDDNNNSIYDLGEEFTDALNGIYDLGEVFIDSGNNDNNITGDERKIHWEQMGNYITDTFILPFIYPENYNASDAVYADTGFDLNEYNNLTGSDRERYQSYQLAKAAGRIQNFLTYAGNPDNREDMGYLFGNNDMGSAIYNPFNNGAGRPMGAAVKEMYSLDQYVNVSALRTALANHTSSNSRLNGGEELIYNAIGSWQITQNGDMLPLANVDNILDENGNYIGGDGKITDTIIEGFPGFPRPYDGLTEIEAQRYALAKEIYSILDPANKDDSNFWKATNDVINFYKYSLSAKAAKDGQWKSYVAPDLFRAAGAVTTSKENENGELNPSLSVNSNEILQPYVVRTWAKRISNDANKSVRATLSYTPDEKIILPGKQQYLFGIDLDSREASQSVYEEFQEGTISYGPMNVYLRNERADDYVTLYDILYDPNDPTRFFNGVQEGHQYENFANNLISNYKLPIKIDNQTNLIHVDQKNAKVKTNGAWFAASGSYDNGRLRSLLGLRGDIINIDSSYSNYKVRALPRDGTDPSPKIDADIVKKFFLTPSVGALYWMTDQVAFFANYSKSVISPTGFQYDVFGELTPAETGEGNECGFKISTRDGKLNAQLTTFRIDKKNEQRSNITWAQLTNVYPLEVAQEDGGVYHQSGHYFNPDLRVFDPDSPVQGLYDVEFLTDEFDIPRPIVDDNGDDIPGTQQFRKIFDPWGYRVADEEARSQGVELDLYYNPTDNLSVFFGYAYLDTKILKSSLKPLEGLTVPGTSDHNLNLQLRYKFKQGKLKGITLGCNQKYRSAALLNNYFTDLDNDGDQDFVATDVSYFNPISEETFTVTKDPFYHSLRLEDQHRTDFFIKWGGKLAKGKNVPWTVFQLNINNAFDNTNLISTGANNARYTEGRNAVISAGFYF